MRAGSSALAAGLLLSACASALPQFEATLASQPSATVALGQWCASRHIAEPAAITAETMAGSNLAPSADVRRLLGNGPLAYRHVRLICGATVLSEAHNWYRPDLLAPEMNRQLASGDTPFGRVVAPLDFRRERLAEVRGRGPGCPAGTVLSHRAALRLPDGRAFSALVECYTRANLAR